MDAFSARGAKVALLSAALFWLLAWGVAGAFGRVQPLALAAYALFLLAFLALGIASFGRVGRIACAVAALVLTGVLAWLTFLDARLVAGGLAVAAAAGIDGAPRAIA